MNSTAMEFVEAHWTELRRIVFSVVRGNATLKEDVFSCVVVDRMHLYVECWDASISPIEPYLYNRVRRETLKELVRRNKHTHSTLSLSSPLGTNSVVQNSEDGVYLDLEAHISLEKSIADVADVLSVVGRDEARMLHLRFVEGYTLRELATHYGKSTRWVRETLALYVKVLQTATQGSANVGPNTLKEDSVDDGH